MDKEIWEGWTVRDFIEDLKPTLDLIMKGQSWMKPLKTKKELKKWLIENQSYYKKHVPEVYNYFRKAYNIIN